MIDDLDSISDFVNFPATDSIAQPNSEEPLLSAQTIHYAQDAPDMMNHDESKLQPQNPSGVGIKTQMVDTTCSSFLPA